MSFFRVFELSCFRDDALDVSFSKSREEEEDSLFQASKLRLKIARLPRPWMVIGTSRFFSTS